MLTLLRKFFTDEATFWDVWRDAKPMLLRVAIAAGGLLLNQLGQSQATWWSGLVAAMVGPFLVKAGDVNRTPEEVERLVLETLAKQKEG